MGVQALGACPLPSEELIFLVSFNVMLILSFSCCFLPTHPPSVQAQGLGSWCTTKPTLSQFPERQSLADLAALCPEWPWSHPSPSSHPPWEWLPCFSSSPRERPPSPIRASFSDFLFPSCFQGAWQRTGLLLAIAAAADLGTDEDPGTDGDPETEGLWGAGVLV